jgi:RimJ/RimL family protein N-acetyltransferase
MKIAVGEATLIRSWSPTDRESLATQANDRRVWINLRDRFPHPYSSADADRFIQGATRMSPERFFAVEVGGALAGGVGYTLHDDVERISAEIHYWLGTSFWGKGIATQALRGLTRYVFSAHPVLRRLYAVPFASNPASARVLEKAGYRREAVLRQAVIKDGHVLDQWMYAILRDEAIGNEVSNRGHR